jgi:hypothetical protein
MKEKNLNFSFLVDQPARQVFEAVNNVRGWWTENTEGNTSALNDEFEVRFEDIHYSKQKLVEVVPDRKVVWLVTDSRLSFIEDKSEWTNTRIVFEISKEGKQTKLLFTHIGLLPEVECYDACSGAWRGYITTSLKNLITKGKGQPEPKAKKASKTG